MKLHFLAALVAAMTIAPVAAQVISGSVQGIVTDESGAVVPGVKVTATNTETGVAVTVQSDSAGLFLLADLRPGSYEVASDAPGFARVIQKGLTVRVGDRVRLDLKLKVGAVSESVEVTGAAPLVQSENNVVGKVVEEVNIKQLPLSSRNAFELILLTPGTQQKTGDSQPRLNGGRQRNNEFSLDGVTVTDPRRGDTAYTPNLDAIQEFKVVTNGVSAEYGRLVGGLVSATLKSGTNAFHGDLFEFARNDAFNARNFFAAAVPKLAYNQFGGIIGGPIRRNKTFFFLDYQGTRVRQGSVFNLTVPVASYLRGDFSSLLGAAAGQDASGRPVAANQIFDPASTRTVNGQQVRDPFPGNIVPTNRFDPPTAKALSLWPQPNRPGLTQNFSTVQPSGDTDDRFDTRIDHRLSDRDLIFGRFSRDGDHTIAARPYAASSSGGNNGQYSTYYTGALNWTRTINPTTVNEARASVLRIVYQRILSNTSTGQLGIPNLSPFNLPVFQVTGFDNLGDSPAFYPTQDSFQFLDNVTLVRGRHILKAGGDARRFRVNDLQGVANGQYTFSRNETAAPGFGTTGHPLASFLLGAVDAFTNSPGASTNRAYERSSYFAGFVQDDFKIRANLNLSLGVRFELEQPMSDTRSSGSNFDLRQGRVITMKELGRNRLQDTVKGFAPRIGLAWQPSGPKTVIRASFGMFYVPLTGMATSGYDRFPATQTVTQNSDGLNPLFYVSQTPPTAGTIDGKNLSHFYNDEHAPYGYMMDWNLDLQRQVRGGILLQATYSASAGRHLLETIQQNVIPLDVVRAAGRSNQSLRPYPSYLNIQSWLPRQSSNYQSMQLSAEKRYASGLTFLFSYTLSKFIDEQEDFFGGNFAMYDYNLRLEKGLSLAHIPQRAALSAVYDLPFGHGRRWLCSGAAGALIGNWGLSSIVALQSGQQVWITQSNNTSGTFSSIFRPNLIADPILPESDRTLRRWFNTGAFQAPAAFALGTSSKTPNVQGPGLANTDLAIRRSFPLPFREGMRMDLRGECFNCFNRVNFSLPNGAFGNAQFGQISAAGAARTMQIAAKFWF